MDYVQFADMLTTFIHKHGAVLDRIGKKQSQLLELSALVLSAEHYIRNGYIVKPANLKNNMFRVKMGAAGSPSNFSWYDISCGDKSFQIHANIPVASAYGKDSGIYVVDVGIIKGSIPPGKLQKFWALDNEKLISFIEAKYLVIYPMLLAQFVGIVHEIKPEYLHGTVVISELIADKHFYPALVATGRLHGTSRNIFQAYSERNFLLNVIANFESEVARMRGNPTTPSPFEPT